MYCSSREIKQSEAEKYNAVKFTYFKQNNIEQSIGLFTNKTFEHNTKKIGPSEDE